MSSGGFPDRVRVGAVRVHADGDHWRTLVRHHARSSPGPTSEAGHCGPHHGRRMDIRSLHGLSASPGRQRVLANKVNRATSLFHQICTESDLNIAP